MNQSAKEVIKYGIVGVSGLAVEWLTFFVFRDFAGIDYSVAHLMSAACGTLNNFIFNSRFTFKATDKIFKRGLSFFGIASIGWALGYLILKGSVFVFNNYLSGIIDIEDQKVIQNISKLLATVIVAVIQFFANKHITFRKKESKLS